MLEFSEGEGQERDFTIFKAAYPSPYREGKGKDCSIVLRGRARLLVFKSLRGDRNDVEDIKTLFSWE